MISLVHETQKVIQLSAAEPGTTFIAKKAPYIVLARIEDRRVVKATNLLDGQEYEFDWRDTPRVSLVDVRLIVKPVIERLEG